MKQPARANEVFVMSEATIKDEPCTVAEVVFVVSEERLATMTARCFLCRDHIEDNDLSTAVQIHPKGYPESRWRWADFHICEECRGDLMAFVGGYGR
jgi:hypothetical protein